MNSILTFPELLQTTSCEVLERIQDVRMVLQLLGTNSVVREQVRECVRSLVIPEDIEVSAPFIFSLPRVRRVTGEISVESGSEISQISSRISGPLSLLAILPNSSTTDSEDDSLVEIIRIFSRLVFVRSYLYPESEVYFQFSEPEVRNRIAYFRYKPRYFGFEWETIHPTQWDELRIPPIDRLDCFQELRVLGTMYGSSERLKVDSKISLFIISRGIREVGVSQEMLPKFLRDYSAKEPNVRVLHLLAPRRSEQGDVMNFLFDEKPWNGLEEIPGFYFQNPDNIGLLEFLPNLRSVGVAVRGIAVPINEWSEPDLSLLDQSSPIPISELSSEEANVYYSLRDRIQGNDGINPRRKIEVVPYSHYYFLVMRPVRKSQRV